MDFLRKAISFKDYLNMNFSRAIKIIRATKGLSQSELAEISGIDASLISRFESGNRKPSINNLEAVSKKLAIPLYLMTLLASEKKDLKGISEKKAQELGKKLLELLTSSS